MTKSRYRFDSVAAFLILCANVHGAYSLSSPPVWERGRLPKEIVHDHAHCITIPWWSQRPRLHRGTASFTLTRILSYSLRCSSVRLFFHAFIACHNKFRALFAYSPPLCSMYPMATRSCLSSSSTPKFKVAGKSLEVLGMRIFYHSLEESARIDDNHHFCPSLPRATITPRRSL